MMTHRTRLATVAVTLMFLTTAPAALLAGQEPAAPPTPQPLKGTIVRGCLTGSRLTQVEPVNPGQPFPASLGVNGIRVIRSQLKALNGHQVELIGSVEGVGLSNGILLLDSDKAKFYLGGGDPNLGEDQRRSVPPTLYAHTVRDIAPTCAALPAK
jgi:hypothetical protein